MYLIFIIFLILLLAAEIISVIGVDKYEKFMPKGRNNAKISIIIPARNEEDFIAKTLESISNQIDDNFKLILIVDRSEDSTLEIVENYAETVNFPIKILTNWDDPADSGNPKVFLLKKGIKAAKGSIYLFTDADCIVPRHWVSHYRKMFSVKNTGLVIGTLKVEGAKSILANFQNFDHIYRCFYAAACVGANVATGGFGNNLAISRDCYESIGGYDALPASVTEDGVMVSSVAKSKYYKVRSVISLGSSVITQPKKGLNNYLHQSLRWTEGALYGPDFKSKFYYIFMLCALTLANSAIPLSFYSPSLLIISIAGYCYLLFSTIASGYLLKADRN